MLAAIVDGTLEPGERLNDDQLVKWLGVSRTPVREAIAQLHSYGLVEIEANRYTRVAERDENVYAEAAQLLEGLNDLGAKLAADKLNASAKKTLSKSLAAATKQIKALAAKVEAGKAARTIDTYRHHLAKSIEPRLGDLRISEATPARLQRFISTVAKESGHGAAKGCRSVLSGMFALAVRHDALRSNPVVAIEGITKGASRASTAIPLGGVSDFRRVIRGDAELERLDLIDLLEFMLFTGCRIGEA